MTITTPHGTVYRTGRGIERIPTLLGSVAPCHHGCSRSVEGEDDRPIWTAAVRAKALFLVTANLKDGPPQAVDGLQEWGGITYIGPDSMMYILQVTKHVFETRNLPGEFAEAESSPNRLPQDQGLSELVLEVLRAVEKRAQAEWPLDPASG